MAARWQDSPWAQWRLLPEAAIGGWRALSRVSSYDYLTSICFAANLHSVAFTAYAALRPPPASPFHTGTTSLGSPAASARQPAIAPQQAGAAAFPARRASHMLITDALGHV